jgi:chromosomal replication initiation ATPase DnaA
MRLSIGGYLNKAQNILISGPTGVGKTYLVCAPGHAACRQGAAALYIRTADFFQSLSDAHLDNRYTHFREKLAKIQLLILDDWGLKKFSLEELMKSWNSLNAVMAGRQRLFQASSRLRPGTICSRTPPWLTLSLTGLSITPSNTTSQVIP